MEGWDSEFALQILPELWRGMLSIVRSTLGGISIAMTLGLVLAIARRSEIKLISWPVTAFIEFIRSTPLLIQLFFMFFALPSLGIVMSPVTTLVLGLGVHYATYASEAYRAGIDAVDKGQWEATVALNMAPWTTWTRVILPQAIPKVLPALGNFFVAMFKDAPLGSTISVIGVLFVANAIGARTFNFVEPFTVAGLLFLAVSVPASMFVRYLEKRYGYESA
ncbi:MAG: ectoine/hydroxyectoine ABC transporter permease subunit EhuD [Euzebya sp.]